MTTHIRALVLDYVWRNAPTGLANIQFALGGGVHSHITLERATLELVELRQLEQRGDTLTLVSLENDCTVCDNEGCKGNHSGQGSSER